MGASSRPAADETAPFYHGYVGHVPDGDIVATLTHQLEGTLELVAGVDGDLTYAPDKWTVRQLLLHMIDTERVFAYRALWFARGEKAPLPGFDQDAFLANADVSQRSIASLCDEFRAVRASTLSLLSSFLPEDWDRAGVASGHPMTTRGAAWVLAGHELHHRAILRDRYLAA